MTQRGITTAGGISIVETGPKVLLLLFLPLFGCWGSPEVFTPSHSPDGEQCTWRAKSPTQRTSIQQDSHAKRDEQMVELLLKEKWSEAETAQFAENMKSMAASLDGPSQTTSRERIAAKCCGAVGATLIGWEPVEDDGSLVRPICALR